MNIQSSIQQYLKKHGFGTFCPKAVLFDMDGVLYDSMPNHAVSWHRSMKQCGIEMAEADAYRYEGMRGVETIKLLAHEQWHRELTADEAQQMYQLKTSLFAAGPPAKKMEGVEQLMQKIKQLGLQIGVVTGSGQHTLLDKLTSDFRGLVAEDLVVTSFDVSHGKPHPEPYLMGLRKCGVEPWQAIVVENAPLGVRAAVAARIFTVGVNTGPLPNQVLADEGASLVFNCMADFGACWKELVSFAPDMSL